MESFDIISKVKVYRLNECNEEDRKLVESARKATESAYSPYSEYNVGAAALLANGIVVTGSNQENAAYPSGLCAERTALFYANAQYPDVPVVAVAVTAFYKGVFTEDVCTPCGSCRQVFAEIEKRYGKEIKILMCSNDKIYEVPSILHLLPLSFSKDSLL